MDIGLWSMVYGYITINSIVSLITCNIIVIDYKVDSKWFNHTVVTQSEHIGVKLLLVISVSLQRKGIGNI